MDVDGEGRGRREEAEFLSGETVRVLASFLLYSVAMFTLPFVAFFGTRHALVERLHVTGFAATAWPVVAAVLTVNAVIVAYAYRGYHEDRAEQSHVARRSRLDAKED